MKKPRTIGILGGMGPEATNHFFGLILKNTAAAKDQDHIPVLIWNDPTIPPRTEAVLGNGPSPLPKLLAGVKTLERGGASLIVMPCLTAHHYAPRIKLRARVPFIDLVEEAVRWAGKAVPNLKTAALLASTGTIRSGLFDQAFRRQKVEILTPGEADQRQVMEAIFGPEGIKAGAPAGPPRRTLRAVALKLIRQGAQAVIAGCTEVPLVLRDEDLPVPLVDPMRIAALSCIQKAGYAARK
ncbi:MAG: aspartate/glutamate racemase family protein [Candidatus Aminicenantes bacterium]|nr:aspartate/glutamate racemase family protein [Candidatus Aminicenantes bacterium]